MNGKVRNVGLVSGGVSLAFLINFAIGYGEVKKDVSHTKEEVKEVKVDVEETEDRVVDIRIVDKEQSIHIQQIQDNQRLFIKEFKELQQAK